MPPKIYYNDMSPQVRAVLLIARALEIELETSEINIYSKDHIDPELVKINPQHTVPTLVDGDYTIWDCHAIAGYLVDQYGRTDDLYPKDPKKRGLVDQNLYFDSGFLHPRVDSILNLIVVENEKEISVGKISAIIEAYRFLDRFLKNKTYLAGDSLTVADLCCVATVSSATLITPISTEAFPNLSNWYRTCKNLPFYEEANGVGLHKLDALVESKLGRPSSSEFCE